MNRPRSLSHTVTVFLCAVKPTEVVPSDQVSAVVDYGECIFEKEIFFIFLQKKDYVSIQKSDRKVHCAVIQLSGCHKH